MVSRIGLYYSFATSERGKIVNLKYGWKELYISEKLFRIIVDGK